MNEADRYSLRDTAIYNPHLLSKNELLGLFSARQNLLKQLVEDLARCRPGEVPQHHLLVGQRGMGKTMLLRRLQFAIEDDPELAAVWLPLAFPEEQYNVGRLSDLWLNCLDALGDALERLDRAEEAQRLDAKHEALSDLGEERRARETLALLTSTARQLDRRLVLLIDNIDLILERISGQGWALREVLSQEPSILLIGASARALESSYKYDQPFYDFFQIHELGSLSLEETSELLRRYAHRWDSQEVLRIVEEEPARIRTLHNLTGGNPRTIALLFNVLRRGLDGNVRTDLESLLDQCTPLYKARLEALPPQKQQVVHALAVHWHPATAADVADELRLEVNAVSSQLARLVKDGLVQQVPYEPATKTGFQLAERFFNIWYLMRATRRARRRLIWLVEFLKMFYTRDQLRSHALEHLAREFQLPAQDRLRFAEYSFALAGAIEELPMRRALETSGLFALMEDRTLRTRLAELVDLEGEEAELRPRAEHKERLEKLREAVFAARPEVEAWSPEEFWDALAHSIARLAVKEELVSELTSATAEQMAEMARDFARETPFLTDLLGSRAVAEKLQEAYARGWMMVTHDLEGARSAAIRLAEPRLELFALARSLKAADDPRALLKELESQLETTDSPAVLALWSRHAADLDPPSPRVREVLAALEADPSSSPLTLLDIAVAKLRIDDAPQATEWIVQAHELDAAQIPTHWLSEVARAWQSLAEELNRRGDHRQAGAAFETAIETLRAAVVRRPGNSSALSELGFSLLNLGRLEEATDVHHQLVELKPGEARIWLNLAVVCTLQGQFAEAQEAARKALELEPENAHAWVNLSMALGWHGRLSEAERAARKALELEPEHLPAWLNLATALGKQGKSSDAEEAARKAVELAPENPFALLNLATALVRQKRYSEAEEAVRKALELEPDDASTWRRLGATLGEQGKLSEAEQAFRKALELEPEDAVSWHNLGRALAEQEQFLDAEQALRKALDLEPEDAAAWRRLGATLGEQGSLSEAEQAFRKALELEPDNASAWLRLGTTLGKQEKVGEAEYAFRKTLQLQPEDAIAWLNLAVALNGRGRFSKAEEAARRALESEPDSAEAWHLLGLSLGEQDRLSDGEKALRRALDLAPSSAMSANALAWNLFRQGRNLAESEELARQAVQVGPEALESAHTLACILARGGKWHEAVEHAAKFIAKGNEGFYEQTWPEILQFFREAVTAGTAREAADLLDRLDMADRWRPLREALETAALGRRSYLRRLAPEVRQPVEEILEEFGWEEPEPVQQRTPASPGASRRRKAKRARR